MIPPHLFYQIYLSFLEQNDCTPPKCGDLHLITDISLKQGILSTSIYYKTTDSYSYVDYHSSHNPSTKNSIPLSQFLRLHRLCSDDADLEKMANEMNRHYPKNIMTTPSRFG